MHRNTAHEGFTDNESQMVSVQEREGEHQYKVRHDYGSNLSWQNWPISF